jgi:transposase-like protein
VATLLRALRAQHARPLPPRPTRPAVRRPQEVFNATDRDEARRRLTDVLARLDSIAPKVCQLLEQAEEDLLAFMAFPPEHWSKLRSTNPLERVNREIGRRSDVVGIFPNDSSAIRLAGALLIEQNDEWIVCRRYLSEESMRAILYAGTDRENSPSQISKEVDRLAA